MANNRTWGMDYIREHSEDILCINAMWQTSRSTSGPAARNKEAWERNSLVEALVHESKSKYAGMVIHTRGLRIRSMEVVLNPETPMAITHGIDNDFYSHSERIKLSVVCKTLSLHLPLHFGKAKTIKFLRRMVFHNLTGRIFDAVALPGEHTRLKYQIAGEAMRFIDKLNLESVYVKNAPAIDPVNARAVAVALASIAANALLSYPEERAFLAIAKGFVSDQTWSLVSEIKFKLLTWSV